MEIKIRTKEGSFAELQIETSNTKITEDLTRLINGKWIVPKNDIEQLLIVAFECSRFNGTSDIEFVKKIFETFLNDTERAEFLKTVSESNPRLDKSLNIRWVSITEKKPPIHEWVLLSNQDDKWVDIGERYGDNVYHNRECQVIPTHWSYLPKLSCI